MIYRMTAQVEADAVSKQLLGNTISTKFNGFTIILLFRNKLLNQIVLEKRMPIDDALRQMVMFFPVQEPDDPSFRPLIQESKALLRCLESLGSFWFNIRSIDIANVNIDWEPEGFAERLKGIRFKTNFRSRLGRSKFITVVDQEQLSNVIQLQSALEDLIVPMSFYREGISEYSKERFGNSFINFFLMIEGVYGKGRSGNNQLINQLKQSDDLVAAIEGRLSEELYSKADNDTLEQLLKQYGSTRTSEGAIELLVKCRGDLHHYSVTSSRKQGTPLNQEDYRVIAFFIHMVCIDVYVRLHEKYTGTKVGLVNFGVVKRPVSNAWP
jgi:hypothetical protein